MFNDNVKRKPYIIMAFFTILFTLTYVFTPKSSPADDEFSQLIKLNKNDICKYFLGSVLKTSPMLFSPVDIKGELYVVLSLSEDGSKKEYACGFNDDYKSMTWSTLEDARTGVWKNDEIANIKHGYRTNTLKVTSENVDVLVNIMPLKLATKTNNKGSVNQETLMTDKMASYATIIGRAVACSAETEMELRQVGHWMDGWFDELNISHKMRSMYLSIFMKGTKYHMNQQLSGDSPDSCQSALRAFNAVNWNQI